MEPYDKPKTPNKGGVQNLRERYEKQKKKMLSPELLEILQTPVKQDKPGKKIAKPLIDSEIEN